MLRSEPRQSFDVWRVPLGDGPIGNPPGDLVLEKTYFPQQDPHFRMSMDFFCPGDRTVVGFYNYNRKHSQVKRFEVPQQDLNLQI